MATIDKRVSATGKVTYRVRARLRGLPPQTKTFERLTDARRWAQSTEAAMREGRDFPTAESRRHTLADLIARYERDVLPHKPRNARNQRVQLEWWRAELGHCRLCDLTPAKIAECRDKLRNQPTRNGPQRAPATVKRYLAVLSHALSVAVKEWGWIENNSCRNVTKPKEPRGRVRFLDDNERTRLLKFCRESASPFLYPIVALAMATGMRRGELLSLHWHQVDLAAGTITLHETKNGERRAIPLTVAVLELMAEQKAAVGVDSVLVFPGGDRGRPVDITKAWGTAVKKAGLQDFRFHDLRHTAASYLAQGGATPMDIADLLGQKTLAMVKRYAHLSEPRIRQVVTDMNERIFG